MHNLDVAVFHYGWPVLIIAVGVYLLYRAVRRRSGAGSLCSEFRFIGDSVHSNASGTIDGTQIAHFIGDINLNLSGAELKSGVNTVNISVFIGDIEVLVPEDMAVEVHCSALFGDFLLFDHKEGGIFLTTTRRTDGYDASSTKVRIDCNAFIGDIKIRNLRKASSG